MFYTKDKNAQRSIYKIYTINTNMAAATLHTPQLGLYSAHNKLGTVHYRVNGVHFRMYGIHCRL